MFDIGESSTLIYEYNVEPPLKFKAGDILGIFQPRQADNHLLLYYDANDGPVNYILTTDRDAVEPPLDMFSLSQSDVFTRSDLPLVTAVIGKCVFFLCALTIYRYIHANVYGLL